MSESVIKRVKTLSRQEIELSEEELNDLESMSIEGASQFAVVPSFTPVQKLSRATQVNIELEEENKPPDGGWGWFIVLGSFLCNVIVDGIVFTASVFIKPLHELHGVNISVASWAGSILSGAYLMAGPLASILVNKYGFRKTTIAGAVIGFVGYSLAFGFNLYEVNIPSFFVFYSVIGGIGFSLIYVPSIIMVGLWFEKRRALATGIAISGSGVGTFLFAPFTKLLVDEFGWNWAVLALAFCILLCADIALLYRQVPNAKNKKAKSKKEKKQTDKGTDPKSPNQKSKTEMQNTSIESFTEPPGEGDRQNKRIETEKKISNKKLNNHSCMAQVTEVISISMLKSPTFILLAISGFTTFLGFLIPFMYITEMAGAKLESEMKTPSFQVTFLLSVIGIANTLGRIGCGFIADRPFINALYINNAALTVAGLSTIAAPLCAEYYQYIIYSAVFGLAVACYVSLRSILIVELLGVEKLTNAFGLLCLFQGIATVLGSPMAGMIFELRGNYDIPFYCAGSLFLLSGFLNYPLHIINHWEKKRIRKKYKKNSPNKNES